MPHAAPPSPTRFRRSTRGLAPLFALALAACGGGGGHDETARADYVTSAGDFALDYDPQTGAVSLDGMILRQPGDTVVGIGNSVLVTARANAITAVARQGNLFSHAIRTPAGIATIHGDVNGVDRPVTGEAIYTGGYAGLVTARPRDGLTNQFAYMTFGDARIDASFAANSVTGAITNRTVEGNVATNGIRPSGTSPDIDFDATIRSNGEIRANVTAQPLSITTGSGLVLLGGTGEPGVIRGIVGEDGATGVVSLPLQALLPPGSFGRRYDETGVFFAN